MRYSSKDEKVITQRLYKKVINKYLRTRSRIFKQEGNIFYTDIFDKSLNSVCRTLRYFIRQSLGIKKFIELIRDNEGGRVGIMDYDFFEFVDKMVKKYSDDFTSIEDYYKKRVVLDDASSACLAISTIDYKIPPMVQQFPCMIIRQDLLPNFQRGEFQAPAMIPAQSLLPCYSNGVVQSAPAIPMQYPVSYYQVPLQSGIPAIPVQYTAMPYYQTDVVQRVPVVQEQGVNVLESSLNPVRPRVVQYNPLLMYSRATSGSTMPTTQCVSQVQTGQINILRS